MKPYGMKRRDRQICLVCIHYGRTNCLDHGSKHPAVDKHHPANRRLKKSARQTGRKEAEKFFLDNHGTS